MSYLDNLIGWADNLFASESREALSEATLIYVIASELLGPTPVAVTPPEHADESFAQLEPKLDAFANAMVEVENSIGGSGGSGSGGKKAPPGPETFYFTIPSNPTLLGYWTKSRTGSTNFATARTSPARRSNSRSSMRRSTPAC